MTIKISDFIDKPVDIPENLLEYGLERRHNTFRAAKTLHSVYSRNKTLCKSLLNNDEKFVLNTILDCAYINRQTVKNNKLALCPYSIIFEKPQNVSLTCEIPALKSMIYVYYYDYISFRSDKDRTYYLMALDIK